MDPFHNTFGCFPSTECCLKTLLNLYLTKCLHHKKSFYLCKCIDIKILLTTPRFPCISCWPFRAFSSVFPNKFPCTFPCMVLVRSLLHPWYTSCIRFVSFHSVFRHLSGIFANQLNVKHISLKVRIALFNTFAIQRKISFFPNNDMLTWLALVCTY